MPAMRRNRGSWLFTVVSKAGHKSRDCLRFVVSSGEKIKKQSHALLLWQHCARDIMLMHMPAMSRNTDSRLLLDW